ncbi:MAG: hypothetical protein ACFFEF_11795 [Candidatus Thorarchaeota archaeon]
MRIKAVLRDEEILGLESGSKERMLAVAMKNLDRMVSQSSLLKVMGLDSNQRIRMLQELEGSNIHIWLGKESQQDIIYLTKVEFPQEFDSIGYQWQ